MNDTFALLKTNDAIGSDPTRLLIDYEALESRAAELAEMYLTNRPFPHIVIDGFLPSPTITRLLHEYPADQSLPIWNNATVKEQGGDGYVQKDKRNIRDVLQMPPTYRQLIWELNSSRFLTFLSALSGIPSLLPDPTLRGGGIHQIGNGGFLKLHVDFTSHRDFSIDRRLNFLLYLNEHWPASYGGDLQLWDKELHGPPVRVAPLLNRCVVFNTTGDSYHGHPEPLTCPEGVFRKSIALYYYTNGRPHGEAQPTFATTWRDTPSRQG
jgi:Rps23 Pro-64 3,4-dihydroxylase Tpa1-like proline 4-hydroxylase